MIAIGLLFVRMLCDCFKSPALPSDSLPSSCSTSISMVAARVSDRRLLRLIRSYLTAGVLDNGLFEDSRAGTPQGGPISPLLSNLVLDELDRELQRRGHRVTRMNPWLELFERALLGDLTVPSGPLPFCDRATPAPKRCSLIWRTTVRPERR